MGNKYFYDELIEKEVSEYLMLTPMVLPLAEKYCSEIVFRTYGKTNIALGFKNDSEGYELRNEFFKGSNTPKDVTTFKNKAKKVAVFEGFFDFLSFISLLSKNEIKETSFCVLNSLSFFYYSRAFLE